MARRIALWILRRICSGIYIRLHLRGCYEDDMNTAGLGRWLVFKADAKEGHNTGCKALQIAEVFIRAPRPVHIH